MTAQHGHKKATKFNRIFDPEFLQARKDITELEIACAEGKFEVVIEGLKADEKVAFSKNRDGNTLLLLAVANGHLQLTHLLLELKSNIHQKNVHKMDAVDYCVLDSMRSPMAKEVLAHCDYVVADILDGRFEKSSKKTIADLLASDKVLARTSLLGKRPDFSALFAKESDYRKEWVSNLKYLVQTVKGGMLLLDDNIGYLERDALLSGSLEVPMDNRYLLSPETQKIVKFQDALRGKYEQEVQTRLIKTSYGGDAMAVQGLLKAKAAPNTEDLNGGSVLQGACHNGDVQTIRCLLVAKALLNATNKDGYTALHIAACRNKPDAVSVLLMAKADLFTRSNKGNSVLDFVKHEGHTSVLEIFQDEREKRKDAKAQLTKKR